MTSVNVGINFSFIVPQVSEERSIFRIDIILQKRSFYFCRKGNDVFPETDYGTSEVIKKIILGEMI